MLHITSFITQSTRISVKTWPNHRFFYEPNHFPSNCKNLLQQPLAVTICSPWSRKGSIKQQTCTQICKSKSVPSFPAPPKSRRATSDHCQGCSSQSAVPFLLLDSDWLASNVLRKVLGDGEKISIGWMRAVLAGPEECWPYWISVVSYRLRDHSR